MKEKILHKVVTFLNRQELDILDTISKDIFFSEGIKVPRSSVLKTLIDAFLMPESPENKNRESLTKIITKKLNEGGVK